MRNPGGFGTWQIPAGVAGSAQQERVPLNIEKRSFFGSCRGWLDGSRQAEGFCQWVKPLMLFQPCFLGGREDARTAVKSVAPFSVREPPEIFRPSSFSCRVRLDCWRWERPHREGSASLRVASRKKSKRNKRNKRSKSRLCPILRRAASFRLVVLAGARRIAGEGLAVVTSERSGFWRGPLRQPRHMIAGQPLGGDAGALLGEAAEAHARCAPNPASSPAWRRGRWQPATRGQSRPRAAGLAVDSVAPAAAVRAAKLQDRASRCLFERLTELGDVPEFSGRPSFRLHGL